MTIRVNYVENICQMKLVYRLTIFILFQKAENLYHQTFFPIRRHISSRTFSTNSFIFMFSISSIRFFQSIQLINLLYRKTTLASVGGLDGLIHTFLCTFMLRTFHSLKKIATIETIRYSVVLSMFLHASYISFCLKNWNNTLPLYLQPLVLKWFFWQQKISLFYRVGWFFHYFLAYLFTKSK